MPETTDPGAPVNQGPTSTGLPPVNAPQPCMEDESAQIVEDEEDQDAWDE